MTFRPGNQALFVPTYPSKYAGQVVTVLKMWDDGRYRVQWADGSISGEDAAHLQQLQRMYIKGNELVLEGP